MNRETNTILSKTGGLGDLGLTITDLALAAKSEIDKIREQSLESGIMTTVFIISAPSGSGKSTLVSRLLASVPGLMFSISYTTRTPRGPEVDGQNYHFISREEFEAMIARDEFLEWAEVFGNYYGTHRGILEEARASGKDLVLDIDVQGARQLKGKIPEAVTIFILAPSRADSGTAAARAQRGPRRGDRTAAAGSGRRDPELRRSTITC